MPSPCPRANSPINCWWRKKCAAAEIAIDVAEQRTQAAIAASAQIRAETEARVAQMETVLQQLRVDMSHQQTPTTHRR